MRVARPCGAEAPSTDTREARLGAVDQLHHQPDGAVLLDDVVDRHRGRVVQPCRGLGLAQRPHPHLFGVLLAGRELHPLDGERRAASRWSVAR